MKKLFVAFFFFSFIIGGFAQPKEVSIIVTGEGPTKEDATNSALRSAVEQAFGVFVSANTEILNDDLVRDEIATISSGNIKSYKEIAYIEGPSGIKNITLEVIVSIGKLISYSQNHGSTTEFAGATFGANMRLYELNRKASEIALENFFKELETITPSMYDYKLTVSDPVLRQDHAEAEMILEIAANEQTKSVGDYYIKTLEALSYSEEDILPFVEMGYQYYAYYFHTFKQELVKNYNLKVGQMPQVSVGGRMRSFGAVGGQVPTFRPPRYFATDIDIERINNIFFSTITSCIITDNLGNEYSVNNIDPYIQVRINSNGEFDFNVIANNHPLYTGVYSIQYVGGGAGEYNVQGALNKSLKGCSQLLGIITNNTSYSPGKTILTVKQKVTIKKDDIHRITSFSVVPRVK